MVDHENEIGAGDAAAATEVEPTLPLEGDLRAVPRSKLATTLLAVTGLLVVVAAAAAVGRFALKFRRPAELVFDGDRVHVKYSVQLLGRTFREGEVAIPRKNLMTARRETRWQGLAFYTGLAALALGTFVGASILFDGIRAASGTLLGLGAVTMLIGVLADYAIATFVPRGVGRCDVELLPRNGSVLRIAGVDADRARRMIAKITA